MDCITKQCVGQTCDKDSECPHHEECFNQKCFKVKSKHNKTCQSHDECSAQKETMICAKKK